MRAHLLCLVVPLTLACETAAPPPPPAEPAPARVAPKPEAPPAPAPKVEKPARRFLLVEGAVQVNDAPAAVDAPIPDEATIVTGPTGYAVLTVTPGSVVQVRAGSRVQIGKSARKEMSLRLLLGSLWSILPKGASYEVVAPAAVAGVRGTKFFVNVAKGGATSVCACSGDVHMQTPDGKSFDKVISSPHDDHKGFAFTTHGKKQIGKAGKPHGHTDDRADELEKLLQQTL
jgi:ferric-dicitrate binding protein FerR (iron transport regulator)